MTSKDVNKLDDLIDKHGYYNVLEEMKESAKLDRKKEIATVLGDACEKLRDLEDPDDEEDEDEGEDEDSDDEDQDDDEGEEDEKEVA